MESKTERKKQTESVLSSKFHLMWENDLTLCVIEHVRLKWRLSSFRALYNSTIDEVTQRESDLVLLHDNVRLENATRCR